MASALRLCAQLSAGRLVSRDVSPSQTVHRSFLGAGGRSASALLCQTALCGASISGLHGPNEPARLISRLVTKAAMGCELAPKEAPDGLELATFGGGCFWGLELAMQRVPGVVTTSVGYTQGKVPNPTYEAVCSGRTGHAEAVQVAYDPKETSYKAILDAFYAQTDPTQLNAQGNDVGTQYRSGIYYHSEEQKAEAVASVAAVQESIDKGAFRRVRGKNVVVEVLPAGDYYIAEGYHQQYLAKGGRFGQAQSAEKGCKDVIRCYG